MASKSKQSDFKRSQLRAKREAELNEQFPGIHPRALRHVRPGAKYVSRGRRSFDIEIDGRGMYYVKPFGGGELPDTLKGTFTNFNACERELIKYLRSKDKFNKAIYPGCQEELRTNSTGTSQRV